jgi:hypothetical protein
VPRTTCSGTYDWTVTAPNSITDSSGNNTNSIYGGQLALSADPVPAQLRIQENFNNLSTINSWISTSGTFHLPGYAKNFSTREIVMRGEVGGGAAGTVIGTLPAGYRPQKQYIFVCPSTTTQNYATVSVATNGNITHIAGYTTSIDLSAIRFSLLS